jgi:filamentous hemagglutinin family protein
MKINSGGLAWHFIFFNSLAAIGILIFSSSQTSAQITPDNTLGNESSVVNPRDATSDSIEGGAIRGQNLFHSFQEFNVDAGRGVYFANPEAITNIFSRVTGNDVSDILGTLGVDGAANLFLINPNGIIFGEDASLDVNGSFAATTADGIEFGEQGFFSTSNPESPKLLTINPSAYLFNQVAPGAIVNNSTAANSNELFSSGLSLQPGKNISLIGGDINLNGGIINAPEGKVALGGLSTVGKIEISENGSLSFPDGVARSDVSLSNQASVNVPGDGGSIDVNARNLNLSGTSGLFTGIIGDFSGEGTVGDDINIEATNEIIASQGSRIQSRVYEDFIGDAGNINIQTGSLSLREGSIVSNSTYGNGNAGDVTIDAKNTISVDGFGNEGIPSGIFSNVGSEDIVGNAGEIKITTRNLTLTNGGVVNATTFGEGNTGKVTINASNSIFVNGEAEDDFFNSGIFSSVQDTGKGNSGGTEITTSNLNVTNNGIISAVTLGDGDSGNINIQVRSLSLEDRGKINASTFGQGDAGKVAINASDSVSLDDGGIGSEIVDSAKGNSGGIEITTGNLSLTNSSLISANTLGEGDAGKVAINASDSVSLDDSSGLASLVENTAKGNSGGVEVTTSNLSLTNGSLIDASTLGEGSAGKITINATDSVSLDGFNSVIFSEVDDTAKGNSGGIEMTTANLFLINGGSINSNSSGNGNSGKISINAADTIAVDGGSIFNPIKGGADSSSQGIEINTTNLSLTNGGQINASTFGEGGNAGKIIINANGIISADGANSAVLSEVNTFAQGNSGEIEITTGNLSLTNGAGITTSTNGEGNGGQITINAADTISADGKTKDGTVVSSIFSVVSPRAKGDAGDINITTNDLFLTNGGEIDASTFGQGDGGEISINATDTIFADGGDSGVFSSVSSEAQGNAGDIKISTGDLFLTNEGQINSSTFGQGDGGEISINATDTIFAKGDDSGILTSVDSKAKGNAGDININSADLGLINRGIISASTFSEGNTGKITINVSDTIIAGGTGGIGSIVAPTGKGNSEGIEITTPNMFLINQGIINTDSFGLGNAGNIILKVDNLTLDSGSSIAASNNPSANISNILSGGNIDIQISNNLILRNNSDISTQASINANGGNIDITADGVIAFDDSDIFAFAADGQGGNINLNTPAYFAENFTLNSLTSNPDFLDNNARADLNATGAVSGAVSIPDVSFIQNSLNDLPNNSINTDELVANSCVSPVGNRQQGKFIITGKGGLPARPGNGSISDFATGEVRNVPNNITGWQRGEPIIEPQGVYRLANGKLVMSRECQ